mgnify:CR=1 FL=1
MMLVARELARIFFAGESDEARIVSADAFDGCEHLGAASIAIGVFEDETLRATLRIATDQENLPDEYAILVLSLLETRGISPDQIAAAARLTSPPSAGPCVSSGGSGRPMAVSALFRYPDQPMATAAVATPYSRMRSQPMIQASSSPKAA